MSNITLDTKPLDKMIGQMEARETALDVLRAYHYSVNEGTADSFYFQPWILMGGTGLGKTYFAELVAKILGQNANQQFQLISMPANAGWNWFGEFCEKACSIDEERGLMYSIPTVLVMDEFQSQKVLLDLFKMILNERKPRLWQRNGKQYFHDPSKVLVILTTDSVVDPAMIRRCLSMTFHPYNRAEVKRGFDLYSAKPIDADAMEWFADRCKPYMGHIVNCCNRLNYISVSAKKVDIAMAQEITRKMGMYKNGIEAKDLVILQRIAKSNGVTIDVLMNVVQDKAAKQTKQRLAWLEYAGLAEGGKHGAVITKAGIAYLEDLATQVKNAKEKRAKAAAKAGAKSK